jgi:hypothetical protein
MEFLDHVFFPGLLMMLTISEVFCHGYAVQAIKAAFLAPLSARQGGFVVETDP